MCARGRGGHRRQEKAAPCLTCLPSRWSQSLDLETRFDSAILRTSPPSPTTLNPKVSPALGRIIGKCLEKKPENRYQSARELELDLERLSIGVRPIAARRLPRIFVASAILALLFTAMIGLIFKARRAPALSEKDYILVTDFSNQTGDPVFDSTLRKALVLDLDQSPYLNVVSDQKMAQTLRLMGRDPEDLLTPEVGPLNFHAVSRAAGFGRQSRAHQPRANRLNWRTPCTAVSPCMHGFILRLENSSVGLNGCTY
jgi:serine/threonine protein kinase